MTRLSPVLGVVLIGSCLARPADAEPAAPKAVLGDDPTLISDVPDGAVATVLCSDGKPLVRARVYCTTRGENLILHDGAVIPERIENRGIFTSPDGTFPIPQHGERFMALILGDDVYAIATKQTLSDSPHGSRHAIRPDRGPLFRWEPAGRKPAHRIERHFTRRARDDVPIHLPPDGDDRTSRRLLVRACDPHASPTCQPPLSIMDKRLGKFNR